MKAAKCDGLEDSVREVAQRPDSYTYITFVRDTAVSHCIDEICDALEACLLHRGGVWMEWNIFQQKTRLPHIEASRHTCDALGTPLYCS